MTRPGVLASDASVRIHAFGLRLYPGGDVRAAELLREAAIFDMALLARTRELGLGQETGFVVFAIGRMAGWLAHALEQRETGRLIRPRARYVGS